MSRRRCQIAPADICWDAPALGDFFCDPCVTPGDATDEAEYAAAFTLAASYVYEKTCRRFPGECFQETVRPCMPWCWCPQQTSCRCGSYNYLDLTQAFCLPVVDVVSVDVVGGECCSCQDTETWTSATGHIRLDWMGEAPLLVRQRVDDEDCCLWWPQQDLREPNGGDCTWSVTALTGCDPPPHLLTATAQLAVEIVAECRSKSCTLAAGATSVTTRGVTYTRQEGEVGVGMWWDILRDCFEMYACTAHDAESFSRRGDAYAAAPFFAYVAGPTAT